MWADWVLPPLVGVAVAARGALPLPALRRAQHPIQDRGVRPLSLRLWRSGGIRLVPAVVVVGGGRLVGHPVPLLRQLHSLHHLQRRTCESIWGWMRTQVDIWWDSGHLRTQAIIWGHRRLFEDIDWLDVLVMSSVNLMISFFFTWISRICCCLIWSLLSGIRYFLTWVQSQWGSYFILLYATSVKANANRAWASAGEAKAVISTWSSSLRWLCFGSVEFLSSSSCCLFLIEPRPSTAIFVIVSSCSCFSELPRGPSSLPTKLNWNSGFQGLKTNVTRSYQLPWGAPSLGWRPWLRAWQAARCKHQGVAALDLVDVLLPARVSSLKQYRISFLQNLDG